MYYLCLQAADYPVWPQSQIYQKYFKR